MAKEPLISMPKAADSRPRWQRAARSEDLVGAGPHTISVPGTDLLAVRAGGQLRVYEGRCPHRGALLGEGELDDGTLVCRNHRWRFDAETGKRHGGPECLKRYPAEERNGDVFVDLERPFGPAADTHEREQALRSIADLPGPKGLPLVGNALQLDITQLHRSLENWAKQYGSLYKIRLGRRAILVVANAGDAATIFRERPDTYRRLSSIETVFDELGMRGVFSAEGEAWRAQRRLTSAALAMRNLRTFYPTLERVAVRLVKRWEEAADQGRVLDLGDELKLFTVDVTVLLMFGHDANTLEKTDEDVIQRHLELLLPAVNRRINAVFPYWRWIRLPHDRELDRALRELHAWIGKVIDAARRRLDAEPTRRDSPLNFIEAMLVARDAEGRPFSEDVIVGNALTMLIGGEDTTAYTVAWAVHHLCEEAAVTHRLRAEIDAVLGDRKVPGDVESTERLVYATAVANESMRVRPVSPLFFLETLREAVVGDVRLPKGSSIIVPVRPPALDAHHFADPERFAPERWLPSFTGAHHPSMMVPFGSGPRICPGRLLAALEMRVALAALYRSFEVERVGAASDVKEVLSFGMFPSQLRVRLHRRR